MRFRTLIRWSEISPFIVKMEVLSEISPFIVKMEVLRKAKVGVRI